MSKLTYTLRLSAITEKGLLAEATPEELRILLALISRGGEVESEDELARLAGTSHRRCVSALSLWEEAQIIIKNSEVFNKNPLVSEEFENTSEDNSDEINSEEAVEALRDEDLAEAIAECAALMDKAALSSQEVKAVCVLSTEYGLSAEYIVTLAAHLASRGKLTAANLRATAKRLVAKEIDSAEALEIYINARSAESAAEWEFRRVIGIYNRNLSPREREAFKRWVEEFGYSTPIVTLAYDICVENIGKVSVAYMDKLISGWHEAGLKTVAECESQNAAHRNGETYKPKNSRNFSKSESPKPRYGDFDIDEAFKHALNRSFGDEE